MNTSKTDNPDQDKKIGDSTALKLVLSDFYHTHPDLKFSTFLGDAVCNSYENDSMLNAAFILKEFINHLCYQTNKY